MKILQLGLSKPGLPPFRHSNDANLRNRGLALTGDGQERAIPDGSDDVESEHEGSTGSIETTTKFTETHLSGSKVCNVAPTESRPPPLIHVLPQDGIRKSGHDKDFSLWIESLRNMTSCNDVTGNDIVKEKVKEEMYCLNQLRKPGALGYLIDESAWSIGKCKTQIYPIIINLTISAFSTEKLSEALRLTYSRAEADKDAASKAPLVGYWLRKCFTGHSECQTGMSLETAGYQDSLPTRLIDLRELSDSKVKIVETNGHKVPYLALSYRWPSSPSKPCILLRKNAEEFTSNGISLDRLVPTVQDACVMTKSLGLQYLWVDALVSTISSCP